jgi:hypothetical protein
MSDAELKIKNITHNNDQLETLLASQRETIRVLEQRIDRFVCDFHSSLVVIDVY